MSCQRCKKILILQALLDTEGRSKLIFLLPYGKELLLPAVVIPTRHLTDLCCSELIHAADKHLVSQFHREVVRVFKGLFLAST